MPERSSNYRDRATKGNRRTTDATKRGCFSQTYRMQRQSCIESARQGIPAGNGADLDRDIDLADFSKFQNAFVLGPGS